MSLAKSYHFSNPRQSIIMLRKTFLLAFYVSLLTIVIGLAKLACAYPSIPAPLIPAGQPQCIVDWYPKNDGPHYGKTQRLTGQCENFSVECSYGITLPLNVPEGLGFLGNVIQGCPDRM